MSTVIHKPHDKLFWLALSDRRVAIEFFKAYLPLKIIEKIDLSTLEIENSKFINELFKDREADIIYKVKFRDKNLYLYLHCEHQSTVDDLIAVRLRNYQMLMIDGHLKQFPDLPIPLIYSIIYYTGQDPWNAPLEIFSFFGEHQNLAKQWSLEPYRLLELKGIPDQDIQQRRYWGLAEYALKHRRNPNFKEFLGILLPWLEEIAQDSLGYTLMKNVVRYVLDGVEGKDIEAFEEAVKNYLPPKLGAEIMTLGQAFTERGRTIGLKIGFEQGMAQGINQGEAAVLLRQLKHRFNEVPENYLKKIQQADAETLLLWSEKLLDAKTVEEIFV